MATGVGFSIMNAVVFPAPDYRTAAASLRDLFCFLGLDASNPLGRWIKPGMTVVIKPNWVKHEFGNTAGRNVLYTHSALVRGLLDAALRALAGSGRVFVVDAPLQGCDFERFRHQSGLAEMEEDYARAPRRLLRPTAAVGRYRRCEQLRTRCACPERRSPGIFSIGSRRSQPPHVFRRKRALRRHRLQRGKYQR